MNDVSVYLGRRRRGESLIKRTSFEAFSCSFCPGTGVLNIHEAKKKNVPLLVQNEECKHEMH